MSTRLSSTSPDKGTFLETLDDREQLQVMSGDGAITIKEGTVVIEGDRDRGNPGGADCGRTERL